MLDLEHPFGQALRRVTRQYRDPGLCQHRPTVVAPRLPDEPWLRFPARRSRAPPGVPGAPYMPLPPKCRQQGGVDVDDASAIRRDHRGGNQLQIAGQHDEIDLRLSQQREPLPHRPRVARSARRGMPRARARASPAASARSLTTSTTPAGAPGSKARSSASRLLPRPEIATAIRIVMAGEANGGGSWELGARKRSKSGPLRPRGLPPGETCRPGHPSAPPCRHR